MVSLFPQTPLEHTVSQVVIKNTISSFKVGQQAQFGRGCREWGQFGSSGRGQGQGLPRQGRAVGARSGMAARGGRGSGLITVEGSDGRGGETELDKFGIRNLKCTIEIRVSRMSNFVWTVHPTPSVFPPRRL